MTNHPFENMSITVLESGFSTHHEREIRESFLIYKFNTVSAGLNENVGKLTCLSKQHHFISHIIYLSSLLRCLVIRPHCADLFLCIAVYFLYLNIDVPFLIREQARKAPSYHRIRGIYAVPRAALVTHQRYVKTIVTEHICAHIKSLLCPATTHSDEDQTLVKTSNKVTFSP